MAGPPRGTLPAAAAATAPSSSAGPATEAALLRARVAAAQFRTEELAEAAARSADVVRRAHRPRVLSSPSIHPSHPAPGHHAGLRTAAAVVHRTDGPACGRLSAGRHRCALSRPPCRRRPVLTRAQYGTIADAADADVRNAESRRAEVQLLLQVPHAATGAPSPRARCMPAFATFAPPPLPPPASPAVVRCGRDLCAHCSRCLRRRPVLGPARSIRAWRVARWHWSATKRAV